jgi:ATP-dependent exoDNAse (exonuclease V) beta subunit
VPAAKVRHAFIASSSTRIARRVRQQLTNVESRFGPTAASPSQTKRAISPRHDHQRRAQSAAPFTRNLRRPEPAGLDATHAFAIVMLMG